MTQREPAMAAEARRLTGMSGREFGSLVARLRGATKPSEHQAIIEKELERLRPIWTTKNKGRGDATNGRIPCPACPSSQGYHVATDGAETWCKVCNGYKTVTPTSICADCRGSGIVSEFGELHPCPGCSDGRSPGIAAARAKVPPAYMGFDLDTYLAAGGQDGSTVVELVRTLSGGVRAFVDQVGRRGLFIYGKHGRGKTGLAVVALKAIADQVASPMAFATWEYYLESRRPRSKDDTGRVLPLPEPVRRQPTEDDLSSAYGIVLDDVGQEGDAFNAWRAEQLYRVLDARTGWQGGFVIITTNLEPDQFRRVFGDRAWSRVEGLCFPVHLGGEDLRRRYE